jgi:hypothetical protein
MRFLRSISVQQLDVIRVLPCFTDRFGDSDNTMGDINNGHGDAAAGSTFPVAMCVLILS